ncbi:MAG: class I SAM-dependent methyltransferase [Xenococcaceae cyanobacterium]
MTTASEANLEQYLTSDSNLDWSEDSILTNKISAPSPALEANIYYFGHPEWASNYFEACHRDRAFKSRWQTATGSWDDKIVVDIGCGPGNVYATVGGSPKLLIGVDVSHGALKMAQKLGYTPLLADAQNLPLVSGFADLVVVNATLHHCDDMAKALSEAARLVRPGGLLVTDHDPQLTAWNYKGLGLLLWKARLPLYQMLKRGGHATLREQTWMLATEAHHKPGDGMTPEFYQQILEPLDFTVEVYPHNHTVGAEVLQGNYGCSAWKYRLGQLLSGINPDEPEAALSLMCVARAIA